MRIISQDGTIDTPYNLSMVWIREKYGYSVMAGMPDDEPVSLGNYSSREKAIKAMEMLRNEYGKHYFGQGGAMATANFYIPAFGFIPPKVFQFPKDDEVEV